MNYSGVNDCGYSGQLLVIGAQAANAEAKHLQEVVSMRAQSDMDKVKLCTDKCNWDP